MMGPNSPGPVAFGTIIASAAGGGSPPSDLELVMTAVVSGQPNLLIVAQNGTATAPGISDNFATPYTWTQVDSVETTSFGCYLFAFIGTGGVGASGTIQVAPGAGASELAAGAVACLRASTASGLSALDQYSVGGNKGTSASAASPSLTPSALGEGAFYGVVSSNAITSGPSSPWANAFSFTGSVNYSGYSAYSNPPSGGALTASWVVTNFPWATIGMIVKHQ